MSLPTKTTISSDSFNTIFNRFISGGISATITASILQPLDVIKTTQQGRVLEAISIARQQHVTSLGNHHHHQQHVTSRFTYSPSSSLVSTATSLVKEQGVISLWKGLNATIIRVFFGAGIYFVALKSTNDALGNQSAFAAGLIARSLATVIMTPISVVKTRKEWRGVEGETKVFHHQNHHQNHPHRSYMSSIFSTPFSTLRSVSYIAKTEGIRSLYSGVLPTLVRDAPFSGIFFAVYTKTKGFLEEQKNELAVKILPQSSKTFFAGLFAGALATLITHPADVLKTRLQIRSSTGTFADGRVLLLELNNLLREEGIRGLFVGVFARVVKRALSSALTWSLFEKWAGSG